MKFLSSGQQLLVGPTGYGQCGCIQNPVHVTMGDNDTCHPLYHQVTSTICFCPFYGDNDNNNSQQGPCSPGFIVTWSDLSDEAVCSPALCGEGTVKWEVSGQLAMLAS